MAFSAFTSEIFYMKHFIFVCYFFAITNSFAQSPQRIKYNFNSSWKVFVGNEKGAETSAYNDAFLLQKYNADSENVSALPSAQKA